MTDTERLDAIEKYGLCVVQHSVLQHGQWHHAWACQFVLHGEPTVAMGDGIRDVIDTAVANLEAIEHTIN